MLTLCFCIFQGFPLPLNIECLQHAASRWHLVANPHFLDERHFNQLHLIMISEVPVCTISSSTITGKSVTLIPQVHARTISIWSMQLFVLLDPAGRFPGFEEWGPPRPFGTLPWFYSPGAHDMHPRVGAWLLLSYCLMDCISISCSRPEFRFSSLARCNS